MNIIPIEIQTEIAKNAIKMHLFEHVFEKEKPLEYYTIKLRNQALISSYLKTQNPD